MMQTTWSQDEEIGDAIEEKLGLNQIDWSSLVNRISEIINPEELYSPNDLAAWAENNGYILKDEVSYDSPEVFFSSRELQDWAEANGFMKVEDCSDS